MENIFMQQALQEAQYGVQNAHGGPFGAVVVLDGKVIGRGHNRVIVKTDPTAHAEMEAIRNACARLGHHNLVSAVLYTTCYPCPMCMGAILWSGIEKAYYCLNSKDVAEIGFNDDEFYNRIEDTQFLKKMYTEDTTLRSDCIQLLEDYMQSPHKMY